MTVRRTSDQTGQPVIRGPGRNCWSRPFAAGVVLLVVAGVCYALFLLTESVQQPSIDSQDPFAGRTQRPTPSANTRWQASQYVGSQQCAECHSDIADAYAKHPMAETLATVAEATPIEMVDGDASEFEALGCHYRVDRVDDRMIHTEFMTGASGNVVYEQSVEVQYSVGSGVTARTYLVDRGGLLFESPITWYTDKRKWDLSPGYYLNPRQRFNRRASDGCVQCHSGRVAPVGDGNSNLFEEQPFPEHGIGCERCHGPGKQHVDRFTAGDWDSDDESDDSMLIVNPARLNRRQQDGVCYQCHMDGQTRILRKDKSFHDFRPGMVTEDIWTVFVSQQSLDAETAIPFTSQVEQMHASACFQGSDGRMSCTTCHDPHRVPDRQERASFYRNRCNNCHADHGCSLPLEERESPPANNSCIHCHMPVSGASDILHASQADHRVPRYPPGEQPVVNPSAPRLPWAIFDHSDDRMPEWEVQRARALALSDQALEVKDKKLMQLARAALEAAAKRDPKDTEVLRKLGFLCGIVGEHARAGRLFDLALQVNPEDEMSLKNSGLMASRTHSTAEAIRSYRRYLKINEWDGTMYGPYAAALANSGDLQAALEAIEHGLELDPTQRELRGLAVQLYARTGNQAKSQQHHTILQEIRQQLDPWDRKRRERQQKQMEESVPQNP